LVRTVRCRTVAKTLSIGDLAPLDPAEERPERLVETADDLLFSRVAVARQARINRPHGFQFVGLIDIAERLPGPLLGLDPLLKAGVVEVAEAVEHVRQARDLGLVGKEPVFVGEDSHPSLALVCRDVTTDRLFRNRLRTAASGRDGDISGTKPRGTSAKTPPPVPDVPRSTHPHMTEPGTGYANSRYAF